MQLVITVDANAYMWVLLPARERGLKLVITALDGGEAGRSREGAWIEIICAYNYAAFSLVAPVRECGLKH